MKPADPSQATITAFNGMAQVIVRSKAGEVGTGQIVVFAEGLDKAGTEVVTAE